MVGLGEAAIGGLDRPRTPRRSPAPARRARAFRRGCGCRRRDRPSHNDRTGGRRRRRAASSARAARGLLGAQPFEIIPVALYSAAWASQKYQRSGLFGDLGAGRSPGSSQPSRSHRHGPSAAARRRHKRASAEIPSRSIASALSHRSRSISEGGGVRHKRRRHRRKMPEGL